MLTNQRAISSLPRAPKSYNELHRLSVRSLPSTICCPLRADSGMATSDIDNVAELITVNATPAAPRTAPAAAREVPPVRHYGGARAYACIREADWHEMEWQLPAVLTSKMRLDFFLTAKNAVDFAVAEYAKDMSTHVAHVAQVQSIRSSRLTQYAKKPQRPKRAYSPPPKLVLDDSSEGPFSASRGAAQEVPASDLRRSSHAANEILDFTETIPEVLESICRHQWFLIRVPYDNNKANLFINNDSHLSMNLRNYLTLDDTAAFTPVSVPGPSVYTTWSPINTVVEQTIAARMQEKIETKRRLVAESEDRCPPQCLMTVIDESCRACHACD